MNYINLSPKLQSPDDMTILLVAYTGTAAFNIHGQTIHSAFSIFNPSSQYKPLGEEQLNTLNAQNIAVFS